MKCAEIQQLLSAYLDNELTGKEQEHVSQHLTTCAQCSQELNTLKTVSNLVSSLPKISAPDELAKRVRHKITETCTPESLTSENPWIKFLFRYRPVLIGATSAAAVFLIIYINIIFLSHPKPITEEYGALPAYDSSKSLPLANQINRKNDKDTTEQIAKEKTTPNESKSTDSALTLAAPLADEQTEQTRTALKRTKSDDELSDNHEIPQALRPEVKNEDRPRQEITFSQNVIIACKDMPTQLPQLQQLINNNVTQSSITTSSEKARLTASGSNQRVQKRLKEYTQKPYQIEIALPVEQKESFIAQLNRLGTVNVSELNMVSPHNDLQIRQVDQLARKVTTEISQLTNNPSSVAGLSKIQTTAAPSGATMKAEAIQTFGKSVNLKAKEKLKDSRPLNQLVELENNLIKKYDLDAQQIARQNLQTRTLQQTKNQESNEGNNVENNLSDEFDKSSTKSQETLKELSEQASSEQEPVMIKLVITLEEHN
jgi:hypothetical protein